MRKTRLVDCDPRWAGREGRTYFLVFACPEGHEDCRHRIPFTPSLEGVAMASPQVNGAVWVRTGDTFDTLTLQPSIKRIPTDNDACAMHINITNGAIEFHADSK